MNMEMKKYEEQMQRQQSKRKEHINEMLEEIKKYEQASVSTIVVERMEKIVTQSLN